MAEQAEIQDQTKAAVPALTDTLEAEVTLTDPATGIRLNGDKRVELLPVDQLVPYSGNARTHSRKQVRQLVKSIKRYGFTAPVLIDEGNQILAGHGRLEAAKLAGLSKVPTLRLSHLSTAEKRGYVIADNRLAEQAGWDREVLAGELQALVDLDFDLALTGFEPGDIDLTLVDADEARDEAAGPEDRIPDLQPDHCVSRLGDLWQLNTHRLLCGDARDAAAFAQLLDGDKADYVFSDPPFNVAVNGHASRSEQQRHPEFAMASGEMTKQAFTDFLQAVFSHLVANSHDGSVHSLCMDWRHLGEMLAAGHASYSQLLNLCVWAKSHFGMGGFYRAQHELVFIWKAGNGPHLNNLPLSREGRSRSNLWTYRSMVGRRDELALHPTIKPVALVADAIKDCSVRGGIVLDPFMGAGTTIIAAQRTGRRARGLEISPIYVDTAVRRWQDYTGKTAKLAATGQTFEEVAEQRLAQAAHGSPESAPVLGEAA